MQVKKTYEGNLVFVHLDVHQWSGRRAMDRSLLAQINPEFGKLPEKELASLGAVKICDPEHLREFARLKHRAEKILEKEGLEALGAHGIPETRFAEVHAALMEIKVEYEQKAAEFVAAYDALIDEWRSRYLIAHPEYVYLLADLPTAEYVAGRISFGFTSWRVGPPDQSGESSVNSAFEQEIGGLRGKLLKDVCTLANQYLEYLMARDATGVVKKREYVTPKTLGPLKDAVHKLESFSFVDPDLGYVAGALQGLLDNVKSEAQIKGADFLALESIAKSISSRAGFERLVSIERSRQASSDGAGLTVVDSEIASAVSSEPESRPEVEAFGEPALSIEAAASPELSDAETFPEAKAEVDADSVDDIVML